MRQLGECDNVMNVLNVLNVFADCMCSGDLFPNQVRDRDDDLDGAKVTFCWKFFIDTQICK